MTGRRWLWVLVLTIVLHVLLISWGSRQFSVSQPVNRPEQIILADLVPLPPVEKPVMLPQPDKPKTSAPKRAAPAAKPRPAPIEQVPDTPIRETVTPIVDVAGAPGNDAVAGAAAPLKLRRPQPNPQRRQPKRPPRQASNTGPTRRHLPS
ncbi:hypothetical protein CAter282_4118 [Collimonas arenae]|uniref:Uncharacterized protein n=1 Tax=Collimonas arenae TaxID=279058 RepID=A0A127QNW0_9BURK|nr:hypothetical protein CAter282_4118 [Collimonas arenae]